MNIFKQKATSILKRANIEVNGKNAWDIQINDETIFNDALIKGSLGFGDGYTNGKWDCERIDVFFEKLMHVRKKHIPSFLDLIEASRSTIINTQAGKRAFHVAEEHYDLGNDMYELMLGESMGYSCGLYNKKTDDLTTAQFNKFDALCKKMELKPGMKLLEIGSGWGTFAKHAAKNYGVEVIGLTVSKEQKKYSEEACKGLPIKFMLVDYRNMSEKYSKYFDRVASIEMIEAVGRKNFKVFFKTVHRLMKDDGIFGLQSIVGDGKKDAFTSTRIFPNGLVPSRHDINKNIKNLFDIKQLDSFGKNYDTTLMDWDKNFRANWDKIKKIKDKNGNKQYDEKFYRMWRYYLMLCAATFRVGHNDVNQIIMKKHGVLTKS